MVNVRQFPTLLEDDKDCIAASTAIDSFCKDCIRELLRGEHCNVDQCFVWSNTEDGYFYWQEVNERGHLTDEDKVRLMMMLGE